MSAPRAVSRGPDDGFDVAGLHTDLRRRGFDLRRAAFVSYLLGTGTDREAAFDLRREASQDGWQSTLYGDDSGWVVRVSRVGLVRRDVLEQDRVRVARLARGRGARPRAVVVEDLDVRDVWAALAERQRAARRVPPVRPAIPAQRRPASAPAPRVTRSA